MRTTLTACASLLLGIGVAAAAAACGSDESNSTFTDEADAGTEGSTPTLPTDAAPVIHEDFANPVIDNGAPANAPALFGAADVALPAGKTAACLHEPEIGTLFPKNWLRPRFVLSTSMEENLFEIVMTIPNEKYPLRIYTTKKSGYAVDAVAWKKITQVGVGTVHLVVRSAVVDAGGALTAGPFKAVEGDFEIAPVDATGSVLYWTTSNGTVLKGFTVGEETTQPVITPQSASTQCVACHTSTPDGLYAGLTASDAANNGTEPASISIRTVDGKATEPPFLSPSAKNLLARKNQHAPSFSKAHWTNGDHVVLSNWFNAGKTDLIWTDLEAPNENVGVGWGVIARNGDPGAAAASVAFSHDGNTVLYVSTTSSAAGVINNDGRVFTVPYANRKGGNATAVAGASDPTFTQYYPTFSADDKIIAFNRVPSGQTSYNNKAAEVFVVPTSGGTATRLAANDPPACTGVKSPGITNSWPKWSPEVKSSGGKDYYFLVFSSTRAAGGKPQLYVAPIMIQGGVVKTYASLYLWNQPDTEANHTPAWDVFRLPGPN